ncbi:MAG: tyrosine-type recombinase/integrase [Planctomycetales bacterium]|nr:tyrosine-type recombinase/integrase [Planctomycetales bacterium]
MTTSCRTKDLLPANILGTGMLELGAPRLVTDHGPAGRFAWEEFFSGKLRNQHTRQAYLRAVRKFLAWVESNDVELLGISPGMIGQYFDQHPGSAPTQKLEMSAIRGFFDTLVLRHVIVLNPALSVATQRFSALEGKTPEITVDQARSLLNSIELITAIDFRDRLIIAMLIFTAARVGAIARLRLKDIVDEGTQKTLKFQEKGGKHRSIPIRHDLEELLSDYLDVTNLRAEPKDSALFRSALGRTGKLSEKGISPIDICRMVKRRLKAANLPTTISPHSFRSCTATDLLEQGVQLEDVQYLLGHSDARVTRLYDRRQRKVTRNIVERISV